MNLTDWLDLLGALLLIAAVGLAILIFLPDPWDLPVTLAAAGGLVTGLSWFISKGRDK